MVSFLSRYLPKSLFLSSNIITMDNFYISPEEFWEFFNSNEVEQQQQAQPVAKRARLRAPERINPATNDDFVPKSGGRRYIIMYGRHKPNKKNKTWESDGFLSLIGQIAYVTDLKGRLLEEPTMLEIEDYKAVEDLSEILIGNTEIQVLEEDLKQ